MRTRTIGTLEVSAIGLGAMGLNHGYGPGVSEEDGVALLRGAVELGCTLFDTAEGYAQGANEELLGRALAPVRDQVVIATKFFIGEAASPSDLERQLRDHLNASLARLGTERVELYYQHRIPDTIPVEDVAAVMGELIAEGRIGGWGQSQPTADQVRRAHAVTPLTAIQSEFSMMERGFEQDVIPACAELGIGFVPFAPLANGFLSGAVQAGEAYVGDDIRRAVTRLQPDNIRANQPVLELLNQVAQQKNATAAQVSLAWMLHKKPFIVPIPGTRRMSRLRENLAAAEVELTPEEYLSIEDALTGIEIHGNRTDADIARMRAEVQQGDH